jgi:hypothetical protein
MAKRGLIWVGLVLVVIVIAYVARAFVYLPLPDTGRATAIHAEQLLPDTIQICGRSWDAGNRHFTGGEIAAFRVVPPVVDSQILAACPKGAGGVAQAVPCSSMVVVRIVDDLYTDYSLGGGY